MNVTREQESQTGAWLGPSPFYSCPQFNANWLLNSQLYYGTWGAGNFDGTLGNNPGPGVTYTNPIGAASQPNNPITQIVDPSGNFLVVTTYGTTGGSPPDAGGGATPGSTVSDGSVIWTVVDPDGQGIRISPVPSQSGATWQFALVGQAKPVRFASLSQTLAPLPDSFEPTFRQGCTAQAYRYSSVSDVRKKFDVEWPLWIKSLVLSREKSDKERDAQRFVPGRSIIGSGGPRNSWIGPAYPWPGPGPGRF